MAQPDSAPTVTLRFQEAREACLDAGLNLSDVCVCHADPTDADALATLLRRAPAPDAFLCANDITAVALMDTLKQLGKRIPHDVRVTGVDDIGLAASAQPSAAIMSHTEGRRHGDRLERSVPPWLRVNLSPYDSRRKERKEKTRRTQSPLSLCVLGV